MWGLFVRSTIKPKPSNGFLTQAFAIFTLFACWLSPAKVYIYSINVNVASLIFIVQLWLCIYIIEFNGAYNGIKAILTGLAFSLISIVFNQTTAYLPSPDYASNINHIYKLFVGAQLKSSIGFILAYLVSSFSSVLTLSAFESSFNGKQIYLRRSLSFFISLSLYVTIFSWFINN